FDLATGKKIGRVPGRQTEPWPGMSFARDGKTLALLGSGGGKIELYDLPSIQLRCSMPFEYDLTGRLASLPRLMFFSLDSKRLATYTGLTAVVVYEATTGKKLLDVPLPEELIVRSGTFSPDGRCLALDPH